MTDPHSDELILWIQQLNRRCLELNTALIRANKLDKLAELADWKPFSRPGRAVRVGVVPRRGWLDFDGQQASYAMHGTGITFETMAGEKISFDYFPQPVHADCHRPILGSWFLQQFIASIEPEHKFSQGNIDSLLVQLLEDEKIAKVHEGPSGFYLK